MNWWEGRLCAFDLETTGVNPREARIVTATVALVGGGLPVQVWSWLVNPLVDIPQEAAAVHGITTERARAEGEDPLWACREIALELAICAGRGLPIVIYNAPYDLTVLSCELARHGWARTPFALLAERAQVVDPLVIDRGLDKYRKGSRKLEAVCAHYGVVLENAHDATSDALAAARLAYKMGRRLGLADLTELAERQRVWYAKWARGLADHLRSKGKEAHSLQPDGWPIFF